MSKPIMVGRDQFKMITKLKLADRQKDGRTVRPTWSNKDPQKFTYDFRFQILIVITMLIEVSTLS